MSGLFGDDLPVSNEETLPETDFTPLDAASLETLQNPKAMSFCLGHEALEKQFLQLIEKKALPHALIFSGLKGIGKATFAHLLARYLLVHGRDDAAEDAQDALFGAEALPQAATPQTLETPDDHKEVRLYVQGAHPDCRVVERAYDDTKNRYKDSVAVDEVRKIAPFLRMTASDGGWRIVIVDDADTMNRSAQNALLKILEEPPKKTLIILIAHRAGALIPTIHSRAQRFAFSPLSDEIISDLLTRAEKAPDPQEIETLTSLAQGSIGAALDMWEGGGLEAGDFLGEMLSAYPRLDWQHIHKVCDIITKAGQNNLYPMVQTLMVRALEDCMRTKAKATSLPDYTARIAAFPAMKDALSLQDLAQKADAVQQHFSQSNFANLDKKQTLLHAIRLLVD